MRPEVVEHKNREDRTAPPEPSLPRSKSADIGVIEVRNPR